MTSPLIHMYHATVYRGTQPVLHDLSLVIARGCSTVILGPNGSGKSTLMKVFSRELYPVNRGDGFVRLMGQEIWNVWELRTQIGIVSSDVQQVYPAWTSGMEVILSGFFSSMDIYDHQTVSEVQRTRSLEMMRKLGIAHLRDRSFGEMSTGEQRRILLGRALVHEPHTLLLDDPTTGVLLKQGRIMEDGPTEKVLNSVSLSTLFDTPVQLLHTDGWNQITRLTEPSSIIHHITTMET